MQIEADAPETNYPAAGADRVLFVLAALAQQGKPMTVRELGAATGLPKSTLYRQLVLLKKWGFVLESDGRYAPGPISLQLALGFDMASHLAREAQPEMQWLVQQSGESVGLVVAVKDQAVCLEMIESRQSLRCSFEKGRGVPLRAGASAKSLLAFMHEDARRRIVLGLPDMDATQAEQLLDELAGIERAGYAVSQGEVDAGVWGVSVPVFRRREKTAAVGSITLMAPATRTQGREPLLIEMTRSAAGRVSAGLQAF
ncbi:IclR family transcriptional regulator [Cupriavidus basilensis]|uniref:IclR family transcriptional regulator n=1 Tax=Cupriavidus TaxID=106589 RepID=UPI00044FDEF2|nr:IclR family transcriptional regulator [Cupriavidus basilensis]MDF3885342.1 IclR family transcriptional regulator [Cupriavidus basilensis]